MEEKPLITINKKITKDSISASIPTFNEDDFKNSTIYVESWMKSQPQEKLTKPQVVSPIDSDLNKFTTFQKLFGEWNVRNFTENLKQWKQILFSIIVAVFGTYCGCIFGVINEEREIEGYAHIRKVIPNFRLVDGCDFGSNLHEFSPWLPETFATHIVAIVILRFAIFCGPYSMRATIFRRILLFMGILYFSRGICLLSTTLPRFDSSLPEPDYDLNDSIFYNGFLVFLQINKNAGDMCFSGHCMMIILFMLTYFQYYKQCPILLQPISMYKNAWITTTLWPLFLTVYVFFGIIICLICTKYHYSLDCLVAFVVTYFLHQWYHFKIRSTMFEENSTYFIALLQWFEQHAEDLQAERKQIKEIQDVEEKYKHLQRLRVHSLPSLVRNSSNSWSHYHEKNE